jgi:hypothetical protein
MTLFPVLPGADSHTFVSERRPLEDRHTIEAQFSTCDDFLPQFALSGEMGRQFSDAWFAARQMIDLGRRAAKPNPPAPPPHP